MFYLYNVIILTYSLKININVSHYQNDAAIYDNKVIYYEIIVD